MSLTSPHYHHSRGPFDKIHPSRRLTMANGSQIKNFILQNVGIYKHFIFIQLMALSNITETFYLFAFK